MYQKILIPISFDEERDTDRPVRLARLLAAPDAKVTLLHVIEHLPNYALSYMPPEFREESRARTQAALDEIAQGLPSAEAILIEGHSGRSILDWAKQHEPDLIIIASHRPGMQDLLLGSTATQVVRNAQCAVHVIR
ncbi:MAG: universal stress protein [Aestuariivita sp.]|nr:universal stress protein [Aestuariivita sp.]MCY4346433.1 universal stress protein [Aestuariivita sp.]